ncbi:MAG: hypothetical protein AAB336_05890 [Acidobacteriota bacterium]
MKKIILFTAILLLIFGLGLALYINSNYEQWQQLSNAKVSKNREFSPFSRVYKSSEGDYLVVSRDSRFSSAQYFIIYTKSNNVGKFSPSSEPFEVPGFVFVPKDRGNVMLASNEKLPAKLKLNDKQIEITGTIVEPKWQIFVCLRDCEAD